MRAPADDDRRSDPHEREVVAARQRGDVSRRCFAGILLAQLRPHEHESHLLAVVNLERAPRGDGHERLRAPAVHRERRALGDVPKRAERVEQRVCLFRALSVSRSRMRRRRSRRGRILGRARLRIRLIPTTTASSRGARGGLRRGSLPRGRHRVLRRPRGARWVRAPLRASRPRVEVSDARHRGGHRKAAAAKSGGGARHAAVFRSSHVR